MSRRKGSNESGVFESTNILCEYYLWIRWCNIREINGYYIYAGLKGNKLSFIHQQNPQISVFFHTPHHNNCSYHTNHHHQNNDSDDHEPNSSIFTPYFSQQLSIPEDTEKDDNLSNKLIESPSPSSASSNTRHSFPDASLPNNNNHSHSHSNEASPFSSPPQSPSAKSLNSSKNMNSRRKSIPQISPLNSSEENNTNNVNNNVNSNNNSNSSHLNDLFLEHWVICEENHILYFTTDKSESDDMYPPSYGWKYNEKNMSSLPKSYLSSENNLFHFTIPPPGISRIPIIPEPMITLIDDDYNSNFDNFDSNDSSNKNGNFQSSDLNGLYRNGMLINGNKQSNGGGTNNDGTDSNNNNIRVLHEDLPVQMLDIVFKSNPNEKLGFNIRLDHEKQILEITNIRADCEAYFVGLKQGDIITAINEEDIGLNASVGLEKLQSCRKQDNWNGMISITVCRRIFDHIMIIVDRCGMEACNGKFYFHHLDEDDCPVFMQDVDDDDDGSDNGGGDGDIDEEKEKRAMIIRKANSDIETGETLWTISDCNIDYYIGVSTSGMPPNHSWDPVDNNAKYPSPGLVFYNRNQKMMQNLLEDNGSSNGNANGQVAVHKMHKSMSHPSTAYKTIDGHFRKPSWKKNSTPWDPIIQSLARISNNRAIPSAIAQEMNRMKEEHTQMTMSKLQEFGQKCSDELQEWKSKYRALQRKCNSYSQNAVILYENLQEMNCGYYSLWLSSRGLKSEIVRLKDVILQHRNRFITVRKEFFQQKRREEDLLDKINALQSHSRQVSSLSKIFDNEYQLDVEALQDKHRLDTHSLQQSLNDIAQTQTPSQFSAAQYKAEVAQFESQIHAKDQKISELQNEVSEWQNSHSQIYESLTSAQEKFSQQLTQFQTTQSYYKSQNNDFKKQLDILTAKLKKSRNSVESDGGTLDENDRVVSNSIVDIEVVLSFNSDESSSDTSTSSNGDHFTHKRRGSKPWMKARHKMEKKRRKEKEKKEQMPGLAVVHSSRNSVDRSDGNHKANSSVQTFHSHNYTPFTPLSPALPNDLGFADNHLSPAVHTKQMHKFPKKLPPQQGSHSREPSDNDHLAPGLGSVTPFYGAIDSKHETHNMSHHTAFSNLSLMELSATTSDADTDANMPSIGHKHLPSNGPGLTHKKARSNHTALVINGIEKVLGKQPNPPMPPQLAHRKGQSKVLNNESTDQVNDESDNALSDLQLKYADLKKTCSDLESLNKYAIESKIDLIVSTANEIAKLKSVINVILRIVNDNTNLKTVVLKMLQS